MREVERHGRERREARDRPPDTLPPGEAPPDGNQGHASNEQRRAADVGGLYRQPAVEDADDRELPVEHGSGHVEEADPHHERRQAGVRPRQPHAPVPVSGQEEPSPRAKRVSRRAAHGRQPPWPTTPLQGQANRDDREPQDHDRPFPLRTFAGPMSTALPKA